MNRKHTLIIVILFTAGLFAMAHAINFAYFTEIEQTVFGDRIKFWHGDTLNGPVRSNDLIAIMQDPVFNDFVITTQLDFWRGAGYNPQFETDDFIISNAPPIYLPDEADSIRAWAVRDGHFFSGAGMESRVVFGDHTIKVWWTPLGIPFDTTQWIEYAIPDSAVIFFDCPMVRMSGVMHSIIIFGCAGQAGLEDNLIYASSDPITGQVVPGHPEKFALIAEGEIKVLNTWENGRENSLHGNSIAINGLLFALNESFTFENQNDPDSGYVCTCMPDDRGTIYLWGGLSQQRRGYVHRATRQSTGYLKTYRYDNDLRHWNVGIWNSLLENDVDPASLSFPDVMPQDTVWDTLRITNDFVPPNLTDFQLDPPFYCPMTEDSFRFEHVIPIAFAPQTPGEWNDTFHFNIPYYQRSVSIPLHGRCLIDDAGDPFILHPSSFSLSSYPNPFNARTVIRFTVPQNGRVMLEAFNVLGRSAGVLSDQYYAAGSHELAFDGSQLTTGIYFIRLTTDHQQRMMKLALIK